MARTAVRVMSTVGQLVDSIHGDDFNYESQLIQIEMGEIRSMASQLCDDTLSGEPACSPEYVDALDCIGDIVDLLKQLSRIRSKMQADMSPAHGDVESKILMNISKHAAKLAKLLS